MQLVLNFLKWLCLQIHHTEIDNFKAKNKNLLHYDPMKIFFLLWSKILNDNDQQTFSKLLLYFALKLQLELVDWFWFHHPDFPTKRLKINKFILNFFQQSIFSLVLLISSYELLLLL